MRTFQNLLKILTYRNMRIELEVFILKSYVRGR